MSNAETNLPVHCLMLEEELRLRLTRNASYSSRALARDMGVTPGYLSQILANKRRPKLERALDIAQLLGWNAEKTRVFIASVQKSQMKKSDSLDILESPREESYTPIESDQFELVSKWYHFAIVELTTLSDFQSQPKWIAARLGISIFEARDAIDRLLRVGLLELKERRLTKTHKNYIYSRAVSEAIRKGHSQLLELGKQALETQTSNERVFVGMTLGIKQGRLPKARQLIDKFYLEFMELMEENPSDAVYQLSLGFFRTDVGERVLGQSNS